MHRLSIAINAQKIRHYGLFGADVGFLCLFVPDDQLTGPEFNEGYNSQVRL